MIDYELMPHQKEAIYKASFTPDLYLAWEMGTGKSCAIVNILRQLYTKEQRVVNTLILAPLIVLKNWKREFELYSNIPQASILTLEGSIKKRIEIIGEIRGPRILVSNYDALQDEEFVKKLLEWKPEILVCDESHILKNYKSKRARHVGMIADTCKHRYLLSGTPILNNAMDLFMQFRIMDGYLGTNSTFGTNFFAFRARYFEDANGAWAGRKGHFPKWQPRPETYDVLNKKIYAKTLRVRKAAVLKNLPPIVEEARYVELSDQQKQMYKEMKRDFVTFIEKGLETKTRAVVAKLAVTKALRLQQIVSGFAKTEDGAIIRMNDVPRLKVLEELLLELTPDHKVIVWSVFKENYKQIGEICAKHGIGYVELHGDVPSREKFENTDRFNQDQTTRVLIGNPGAGGIGINLIASDYSIYYSRGFKLGDDLQSEARNHRRGSEIHERITRINLVAPGTIDEIVAEALAKKLNVSEQIIDRLKEL